MFAYSVLIERCGGVELQMASRAAAVAAPERPHAASAALWRFRSATHSVIASSLTRDVVWYSMTGVRIALQLGCSHKCAPAILQYFD
jgi:hypothetical protein